MKYTYGTKLIEVKNNVVVSSNELALPTGTKVDAKYLRLAGWCKEKTAKIFYAKGLKDAKPFRD